MPTDLLVPSSKGKDGLIAGAIVTVLMGTIQEMSDYRFDYPGFEAALVVLMSYGYAAFAAARRKAALE